MRLTAIVLCFALGGCVVSVNPVVNTSAATFDARLVGTWQEADGKDRIVVTRGDANLYAIDYTDSDGQVGHFEAHLGRLGQRTVLDVQPTARESSPMPEGASMIRGHIVYVVTITADSVRMSLFDPKALRAAIKSKSVSMASFDDHDQVVLTGDTGELQRALGAYIERKGALDEPSTWRRVPQ